MNTPLSISTALQYQRSGRMAEAEQVYKLLLQEQPQAIDALNLLGALVYEDQRFEEAEAYFAQVLTLQPGAESHNSMGIVLKAQGKYEEALAHYQQALALKPQQPEVLSNLGNVLKELGQLEEAIASYEQALTLNPNYAEAHNNLGIVYKEKNDLERAIACYETAIRLKPNYPEAHHNLGSVLRLQNQLDEAVAYFQQAIALKPTYAEAYISLASTLQQQEKTEAAIVQYERLIALKPDSADGYNNLGLALQQQRRVEEAIAAFQQALVLRPNFPGGQNNLGNLFLENRQLDEAIASYEAAIAQRPNYPEALNNLGNVLQQKGDLAGAVVQYRKALELRPQFVEALSNLGAVLKDQHQLEEAVTCLEQAIAINPNIAEIHNNLGNVYQDQKRVEAAIAHYRQALALKPEMVEVRSNLGNMLQYVGEFAEAFEHFSVAIAAQPDFAGAYNNLGIAYRNAGQVEAAFAEYERAIELKPDFVEAHWNKALNYLLLGDFERGFAGYEWRFKWSRFLSQNPARTYTQPRWDGSDFQGKTLLLYAEQGMGDTLQFVRYLPLVKAKGGRIVLECHPPLHALFQQFTDVDQLIPLGAVFSSGFDVHAPLMSLPHILGTTLDTIPATVPYLRSPKQLDRQDFANLADLSNPNSFKVGLVWDGNPQNPYNRLRTVPLADLLPLAELPGITLYSLQKEPQPADLSLLQAHPEIVDCRSHLTDFTDTAALIDQLDLVISIDTAVTHLAGAMGKPTWLLLPLAPDWRWLCDRADSPWYPTMRLFRQLAFGDWRSVVGAVRRELGQKAGGRGQEAGGRRQKQEQGRSRQGKKRRGGFGSGQLSEVGVTAMAQPLAMQAGAATSQPVVMQGGTTAAPPLTIRAAAATSRPLTTQTVTATPSQRVPAAEIQAIVKLHQAGRVEAARRECAAYLERVPESADGWHLLGLMAHYERQLPEAIAHYQRALQADAKHLDTYNNLAVALHEQGQIEAAMPYYQKAIALNPQGVDAHNNYANALRDRGRLEEAIPHYQQAIAVRPEYADAYNNLGLAYYAQGDFERAAAAYRQAVERRPEFPQALNHLGNALKELGQFAEASHYYQQAIALKPDYAKAYNNWGNVFRDSGDLQTAVQYYDQATAIEPNFAEAHWNKALTLLLGGDLQRGFEEYEWRKYVNLPSFRSLRDFPGPRWDGSPLNGQIIYLHAEQGMGDIIQFVRYVPFVVQQGGRVLLECHPPLLELLSGIPGVEQLVPYGGSPPGYQIQAPLLSLAHIFRSTAETVPAQVPYLQPPASSATLPPATNAAALKVGIVWSGNPDNPYNRTRAVPLELLLPLATQPGVELYSLQKDLQPGDQELLTAHPQIHDLRSRMTNFVDTAALIQQLDLVISVDTAMTHLAGALGKAVWLLLPFAPDWRWMLHREDSPWYPTLKIFRQARVGEWAAVVEQVREELGVEGEAGRERKGEEGRERKGEERQGIRVDDRRGGAEALAIAFAAYERGDLGTAEQLYRQILEREPEQPDALHVLSVILGQRKQLAEAEALIRKLVALQPEFGEGWRNLGGVLQEQQQFEGAIAAYERALALDPDHADVQQNLSTVLLELDRPFAALPYAQRVAALKPDNADAHYNLGYTLRRAGQVAAAIACYRQAIALSPEMAMAHKNLGHALLLQGDLIPGFEAIEWRWQQPGWARRSFTQPEWDGSDLTGKTILLYAEQGFGDTLQFIRYLPLVQALGGRVMVECQAELIPLLAQLPDCDRWIEQNAPLPAFDVHAPLMSLPRLLQTTIATIPARPYLKAEGRGQRAEGGDKAVGGFENLLLADSRLKVGIVWAGNPGHRNDRFRSCGLEVLRPLLAVAEVRFYSLQKGEAAAQLQALPADAVVDWGDRLESFVDTAEAIAQLDLVITVDTAVAHLAGAMGKPVWVLLMFAADWRWLCDREDTPWYPTLRLFRQTAPGDWAGVVARVGVALREEAEGRLRRERSTERRQKAGFDVSAQPNVGGNLEVGGVSEVGRFENIQLLNPTDRRTIALSWLLDDYTDWGIVGTQWVLQGLQDGRLSVVPGRSLVSQSHVNPLVRSRLEAVAAGDSDLTLVVVDAANVSGLAAVNPAATVALVGLQDFGLAAETIAFLQQCRAVGVGSTWGATCLQQVGVEAAVVPLLGVDEASGKPLGKTGLLGDRFVVFSTADDWIKGQDILITAFRALRSRHPEAFLLLAGENSEGWRQAQFTPDEAMLMPAIAAPVLQEVLREVDVAVFPSRCETGANQAIAATLAHSIPTVLANHTANRDLIQLNLGFPLMAQRPVKGDSARVMAGWGESDPEEVLELLEYIYSQRREARTRGAIAADFMQQWTWARQWQEVVARLGL